ncbi:acyltransferase [Bacillus cytotoxicus]|uniref:acyltransferase n=1 Tax=Bacillus cytotoxicus TaxID=580165 RepID=UPI0035CC3BB9
MLRLITRLRTRLLTPEKRAEYFRKTGIVKMGTGCEIYNNVSFGSEPYLVQMGDKVRITAGVRFVTHDGGLWVIRNLGWSPNADKMGPIIIGDNVFIGWNTIVMPGITIGSNVVIGAGSIVSKDVPDNTVVAGIPAKVICSIEEYYNKNLHRLDETKNMSFEQKKKYYLSKFNLI